MEPTSDLATRLPSSIPKSLPPACPRGFDLGRTAQALQESSFHLTGPPLVAHLSGAPGGCGAVRRLDDTTAEIDLMWIDAGVRGHGLGRRLLEALEDTARDLDCSRVRLDTSAHLTAALALHHSGGYDPPATMPTCTPPTGSKRTWAERSRSLT